MTNYFDNTQTVADTKKLYHKLAMQYHPDRGGDTATMQTINDQYIIALQSCNGEEINVNGKTWNYKYNDAVERDIIDTIDKTLRAKVLNAAHEYSLIGKWLWIVGDTKPIKDTLKKLGYHWHSKRKAWYWKPAGTKRTRYNQRASLGDIARAYGAETIATYADDKQSNLIAA